MMNEFKCGDFEVYVADPYPQWVSVRRSIDAAGNTKEIRFHHNELDDLIYLLEKAARYARSRLNEDEKHEIVLRL